MSRRIRASGMSGHVCCTPDCVAKLIEFASGAHRFFYLMPSREGLSRTPDETPTPNKQLQAAVERGREV
jgi:hypothetical protein